jgi:hypothetical protein
MESQRLLAAMCTKHGLPTAYAAHLVPAVAKALELQGAAREEILALVERSIALRSEGLAEEERKYAHLDHELLVATARTLHHWRPDEALLAVGESVQRFREQGDAG